jgi:GntR family transcriptional regulator
MGSEDASIRFRLDPRTGVPPYRQLVDQVAQAVRLGFLHPGDRLPSVREVVTQISINPNTVHRAYREMESEHLVEGRPGLGTFVADSVTPSTTPRRQAALEGELRLWVRKAKRAGVDSEGIRGLLANAMSENEHRLGSRNDD